MPTLLSAAVLALVLGGCGPGPTLPEDRFRLSVEEIVADGDMVVSVLKITVPVKASVSVDTGESHNHVTPGDPLVDGPRDAEVLIAAARVAPARSVEAFVQVLLRPRDASGYAGGPQVFAIPAEAKLEEFFKPTAAEGIYPLDRPLKIAELRGQPVNLTVGKPTR